MNHLRDAPLMRLRPRADRCHVSCGATVLITDPNGIIEDGGDCGLFVHETRVLSRYRLQADGRQPVLAAASNISQQTWLGYYLVASSDSGAQPNITEMAQQAVELRLSRRVAHGMHEHIDIENFTQTARRFDLAVHVAADFADLHETHGERRQQGTLQQHWRRADDYAWELAFDYEVTHHYAHQGISGTAQLRRGSTLRVADASSAPRFTHGRIEFSVNVAPHGCWHVCLQHLPRFDGCETETFDDCERLLSTENDVDPAVRSGGESTTIRSTDSDALSAVVIGAVAQAERDLTALRLRDCDLGGDAWTVAAGIPAYVALFGRDTLATAGRSALLGSELMRGTLLELAR